MIDFTCLNWSSHISSFGLGFLEPVDLVSRNFIGWQLSSIIVSFDLIVVSLPPGDPDVAAAAAYVLGALGSQAAAPGTWNDCEWQMLCPADVPKTRFH